jgi:hypothetical protein
MLENYEFARDTFQIEVRPFPNVNDGLLQVSTQGGTKPLCRSGPTSC